jgi:hypothetical protein
MNQMMFSPVMLPIGGYSSSDSFISSFKSLSFFLLFAGLLLITVGYVRSETFSSPPRVEFRYVPRTFKEEQDNPVPVMSIFSKMFDNRDPWSKYKYYVDSYPWEKHTVPSKVVRPYNHPESGFGRAVGQRVLG